MSNIDNEIAQLAAEEKKLIEQQKKEREALRKKVAAIKKKIREEQRKLDGRRTELLGHCMLQKFNSDPGAKEAMMRDLDGFLSKPEARKLFNLFPRQIPKRTAPEPSPIFFSMLADRLSYMPDAGPGPVRRQRRPRRRSTGEATRFY